MNYVYLMLIHPKMHKSMFGIFSPGLKSGFFTRFSPFFIYIVTAMCMKKRTKRAKNPSFQHPAKNPKHALRRQEIKMPVS